MGHSALYAFDGERTILPSTNSTTTSDGAVLKNSLACIFSVSFILRLYTEIASEARVVSYFLIHSSPFHSLSTSGSPLHHVRQGGDSSYLILHGYFERGTSCQPFPHLFTPHLSTVNLKAPFTSRAETWRWELFNQTGLYFVLTLHSQMEPSTEGLRIDAAPAHVHSATQFPSLLSQASCRV